MSAHFLQINMAMQGKCTNGPCDNHRSFSCPYEACAECCGADDCPAHN